jgi:hypothetical protein
VNHRLDEYRCRGHMLTMMTISDLFVLNDFDVAASDSRLVGSVPLLRRPSDG